MERNGDLIGTFERKQRMRALYRGEIMINSELGDIQKLIDEDRKAEAAERYFDVFRVIRAHCRVNRLISALLLLLIAVCLFAIVCDLHAPQRKFMKESSNLPCLFCLAVFISAANIYGLTVAVWDGLPRNIGGKYSPLARPCRCRLSNGLYCRKIFFIFATIGIRAMVASSRRIHIPGKYRFYHVEENQYVSCNGFQKNAPAATAANRQYPGLDCCATNVRTFLHQH